MKTISNIELQELLQLHKLSMLTRKCRIYCSNNGIDIEGYRVKGCDSPVVYNLPIDIAIGIVEGTRMTNPNRASTLTKLKETLGKEVTVKVSERKEVALMKVIEDVMNELGFTFKKQYFVEGYFLDGYIVESNIAIEFDEFHHNYYVQKDSKREDVISNSIGCSFVRIKEEDSIGKAIGTILKYINAKIV